MSTAIPTQDSRGLGPYGPSGVQRQSLWTFVSPPQRAHGNLTLGVKRRGDDTVLDMLHQEGCLKARLPRPPHATWAEAISLNNSGGVAAGDRLSTRFALAPFTRAVLASASCERVYRGLAADAPALIRNRVELAEGARGEWLPQQTILFDGCKLDRALDIEMSACASLLGVETIIFGRVAMGEAVNTADLKDVIRIRVGGRLVLHDALRPPRALHDTLQRQASGSGARASTTLFLVSPTAENFLDDVRAVLGAHGDVHGGASAWDGMLVVRMLAADPAASRRAVIALLHLLREGRMLPRVWTC